MLPNSVPTTPDYETIKKRLSKVNKTMYRTGLVYDPIALLEKSAITGRAFDKKEPKPKKKKRGPPDPLSLILKSHHRNDKAIKIYQLPKLPFGVHNAYNFEESFVRAHFKIEGASEDLTKNLEILTRKFRLNDKNQQKRAKSSHGRSKKREFTNTESHRMASGYLVCPKETEITEIYDKAKTKSKDLLTSHKTSNSLDQKARKKAEIEITNRLHPSTTHQDSPISKFYNSKYSALFSDMDTSTRPVTSFRAGEFKGLIL